VRTMVSEAVQAALSGRPGPVFCEVPTDLWDREVSREGEAVSAPDPAQSPEQWSGDLERAAKLLCEAERPVIVAPVRGPFARGSARRSGPWPRRSGRRWSPTRRGRV
jgi:thiamine pyrophosphate-dependent acetolactate synthase large subunit-like protein